VRVAEARLKLVLGIASLDAPLLPVSSNFVALPVLDEESLVAEALAIRPDVKAARFSIQAAQHRVALARKSFLRIDAVADGNHGGEGPNNAGPGLRFELPIFNRNQGLVIRSQWTVDQASHNYYSVRDRVITEVRSSVASVGQVTANLKLLREMVLPDLQDTMGLSEAAYRGGGDTYFLVLQSTNQYISSRIRELELVADLRRATAELERSVGRRVVVQSPDEAPPLEPRPSSNAEPAQEPFPRLNLLPAAPDSQAILENQPISMPAASVIPVNPSAGIVGLVQVKMDR
jgi:cobalt-zinc-cadmium efflux system outer membrane protein